MLGQTKERKVSPRSPKPIQGQSKVNPRSVQGQLEVSPRSAGSIKGQEGQSKESKVKSRSGRSVKVSYCHMGNPDSKGIAASVLVHMREGCNGTGSATAANIDIVFHRITPFLFGHRQRW